MLLRWTPAEQVPSEVIPFLEDDIATVQSMIQPARPETWGVVLDAFIGWIERFGIMALSPVGTKERKEALGAVVRDYRNALHDIPDDLLKEAFDKTIQNHGFRNLPLFAEVRGYVDDELRDRKRRFDKLNSAKFMLSYRPVVEAPAIERKPRTDQEKAMVEAINKVTRANLQKID